MTEQTERRMQQELRNRIDEKLENLRDQFAMAALTGMLANPGNDTLESEWASDAFLMADAMMRARGKAGG